MFKYIASFANFISRVQFNLVVSPEDVMFALKSVEDSEFLLTRFCLLFDEIFASTLISSVLYLPAMSKLCSK